MKSGVSFIVLTKMFSRYCLVAGLLLSYLVNLSPGESFLSDSQPAEKTELVFNEADPDFSNDYEIDLLDEKIISTGLSNAFYVSLLKPAKEGHFNALGFPAIHLEIPIPPPRLNS